jgi:hypothetical protein
MPGGPEMKRLCVVALAASLTGCAADAPLFDASDAELRAAPDLDVCQNMGIAQRQWLVLWPYFNGSPRFKAELKRRHLITQDEWPSVIDQGVHAGFSKCAVLAAWGPPNYIDDYDASVPFGPSDYSYGNKWEYFGYGGPSIIGAMLRPHALLVFGGGILVKLQH